MKEILVLAFSFSVSLCFSQIILDENLNDWKSIPIVHEDPANDHNSIGIDFTELKITSNQKHVYFLLDLGDELYIQNDNNLEIYIDTDNNPNTGFPISDIGADFRYFPGQRFGLVSINGNTFTVEHTEIGWVSSPTVSAEIFEVSLNKVIQATSNAALVIGEEIKLLFRNGPNGDRLPDANSLLINLSNIGDPIFKEYSISKLDNSHLRVMTYNVLRDRIFESFTESSFRRIFKAIQPDIICFQEVYDHSSAELRDLVNTWIPANWFHRKEAGDIIVLSKYPITESQNIGGNGAFKISVGTEEVLVINTHLPCCENDSDRQFEVDQILDFIKRTKVGSSQISLAENSPIVICGDMNFVGEAQQPRSLITGDIVNEDIFGSDFNPDWNNTDLKDPIPGNNNLPFTYTWYSPSSSFSAGRLDYLIYTDYVLQLKNSYSMYTPAFSAAELDLYRLDADDTNIASDHLPVVADFEIGFNTSISRANELLRLNIWPNPSDGILHIQNDVPFKNEVSIRFYDLLGRLINQTIQPGSSQKISVSTSELESGLYLMQIQDGHRVYSAMQTIR